ncbi:hypothetical protein GQ53DRAFT_320519 [Thozetella sp. PMI_491]|nr:hypothetical protein GQ53DRAFT_320519 [Thozetella sp. PMI_491]
MHVAAPGDTCAIRVDKVDIELWGHKPRTTKNKVRIGTRPPPVHSIHIHSVRHCPLDDTCRLRARCSLHLGKFAPCLTVSSALNIRTELRCQKGAFLEWASDDGVHWAWLVESSLSFLYSPGSATSGSYDVCIRELGSRLCSTSQQLQRRLDETNQG